MSDTEKRFFRWVPGRQQTGYDKMLLITALWPLPFDCYLLRFKPGQGVPPHVDQVEDGRHYRLNLVLRQARAGGEFVCDKLIYESRRIKLFRPDIAEHSVSEVTEGSRYVLSIGWVRQRSSKMLSDSESM